MLNPRNLAGKKDLAAINANKHESEKEIAAPLFPVDGKADIAIDRSSGGSWPIGSRKEVWRPQR